MDIHFQNQTVGYFIYSGSQARFRCKKGYRTLGGRFNSNNLEDSNFSGPLHLTDFAHMWHVNAFIGPYYEMDVLKFQ